MTNLTYIYQFTSHVGTNLCIASNDILCSPHRVEYLAKHLKNETKIKKIDNCTHNSVYEIKKKLLPEMLEFFQKS